jgi:hypothetical protein
MNLKLLGTDGQTSIGKLSKVYSGCAKEAFTKGFITDLFSEIKFKIN